MRDMGVSESGPGRIWAYHNGKHVLPRHDGTNRETTGEGAGLRKQPGKKNRGVKRADKRRMEELRVEIGLIEGKC